MTRRIECISFFLVFTLLAGSALAQETVEPTNDQEEYNNSGAVLMQKGKYGEAIASFKSSLSVGELNITFLNLGRAYYRAGLCLDAREAYDAVESAPRVAAPAPAEVSEILARFRSEYEEKCSASIVFACTGSPSVRVGETMARPCDSVEEWPVVPGPTKVVATYGSEQTEKRVDAVAGERTRVEIDFGSVADEGDLGGEEATSVSEVAETDSSGTLSTVGWIATGLGGALIGGALVYDLAVTGSTVDELESLEENPSQNDVERAAALRRDLESQQTTSIILGAAGAAVLTTGIILILLDGPDDAAETTASTGGWVSEDGAGITLMGRW